MFKIIIGSYDSKVSSDINNNVFVNCFFCDDFVF